MGGETTRERKRTEKTLKQKAQEEKHMDEERKLEVGE